MKLYDLIDREKLYNHLQNGMVSKQHHPEAPLAILNYTHRAQHEQIPVLKDGMITNKPIWGDGTIDWCRGLIFDIYTDEIVALPFKKFHNLNTPQIPETMYENLPWGTRYSAAEKVDGSLGIYYNWQGVEGIATRGSFTSPQAQFATRWFKENIYHRFWTDYETPLFEIVYPENRIVVDYDGWSGLILLGVMNKNIAQEMPWNVVQDLAHGKMRVAKDYSTFSIEELAKLQRPNTEGFVITFSTGLKLKIKTEEYKRLHRVITGMNPNTIWESLRDGKSLVFDLGFPESFKQWARLWIMKLNGEFNEIYMDARAIFDARPVRSPEIDPKEYRATCANYFKWGISGKTSLLPILFAMLDEKDPAPAIWKQIEPKGNSQLFKAPIDSEEES